MLGRHVTFEYGEDLGVPEAVVCDRTGLLLAVVVVVRGHDRTPLVKGTTTAACLKRTNGINCSRVFPVWHYSRPLVRQQPDLFPPLHACLLLQFCLPVSRP